MEWLSASPMPPLLLLRFGVAAVWLYEGLWCKLLGGVPNQANIVAAHPLFGRRSRSSSPGPRRSSRSGSRSG